jgi:translation initiation factor 1
MSLSQLASLLYKDGQVPTCPTCGQPLGACTCNAGKTTTAATATGSVRVGRETKGRAGKGVTVISGLALSPDALQALGTELKKRCGSGGTVRDGVIEIQGEHRDTLIAELGRRGIVAKRAGG